MPRKRRSSGTVTDATGAVLPGAKCGRARATGNSFETVADERGAYAFPCAWAGT